MRKPYADALFAITIICPLILCRTNIFANTSGKINATNVNLRTAPNINSQVLKNLSSGQAINILSSHDDFYEVSLDQTHAYVSKQFVDISNTQGVVNASNVNIRLLPSETAKIISKVNTGDKLNINATTGDWFAITYNNEKAYISKKFVDCDFADKLQKIDAPEFKLAIVTSDNGLNLREGQSSNTNVICCLPYNCVVNVVDNKTDDWIKVSFENNLGYVNSNYVKIVSDENLSANSTKAQQIIEYAKKFIGTPYRYSGRDLNKGVDCSGFVYCVMKHFGVNLNSSSRTQVKNGVEVAKANLMPGDLVFFSNNGAKNVQHVGIYIGNHQFIHSASPNNKGVMISGMNENYYVKNYVTARRVL